MEHTREKQLVGAWVLLAETGPCLHPVGKDASRLMLQPDLTMPQLVHGLLNVFKTAETKLRSCSLAVQCKQPARLFSTCVLLSQLALDANHVANHVAKDKNGPTGFHLNNVGKTNLEQAEVIFDTLTDACYMVKLLIEYLKTQPYNQMQTLRRCALAQTFGKAIFTATLDSSYAGAYGKQLNTMLQQDRISDGAMSSRLSEMWMGSSQCCKYGSLLRIRAQILLLSKLLEQSINGENDVSLHSQALAQNLIPSNVDKDVCNRGVFFSLRTRIVNHLIAPCCNATTAPVIAEALEGFVLGELTSVNHTSGSKSSLVELASMFLGQSDSAMTSLALALTVSAYGLLGNDNVHTHKNPNMAACSSIRWRTLAFEDETLRRKANPFCNPGDSDNEKEPTVTTLQENGHIARWTSLRKREFLEMETYSEIFHISEPLREDSLVMQLRCLTRAYFCYATFKASQAEAGTRSWLATASSSYRGLLTAPTIEKGLLCPPIRKPDARRAQFLQCATLMLMDCAINDICDETVSMARLETQLDALGHFNRALFEHTSLKHQMIANERSDKRWGAKIVGSFTPMLVFLLSDTLHDALFTTFDTLRAQLQDGTLSLQAQPSSEPNFPDVGELLTELSKNARTVLQYYKNTTDDSIELSFTDKKALNFAIDVLQDVWRVAPTSDGWVNVLHFRSCRVSEKRARDEGSDE